ncbi:MAG: efflux RND transporter periplasmic adaptor subunit [SAR202 cluster bacterium]|nr:efflux RND transporter periplasmic adaptor subunit [SAR202 cluster bacterium]
MFGKQGVAIKGMKLWQAAIAAVAVVGAGGAGYVGYSMATGPNDGLGENEQVIPVQVGDLVNDITINGSLAYGNRETLQFSRQGTVANLSAVVGRTVTEGQALARLDSDSISALEKQVTQAKISLIAAEKALAAAKDPFTAKQVLNSEIAVANAKIALANAEASLDAMLKPSAQSVAQSELAVINATTALDKAQAALDRIVSPTEADVAKAKAAVASAATSLRNAGTALNKLMNPSAADIAKSELAVASARTAYDNAVTAYADLMAPPTVTEIADANSRIAAAEATLLGAQNDLKSAQATWDGNVKNAEAALSTAEDGYRGVYLKWLGIDIGDGLEKTPEQYLSLWGADLKTLFDKSTQSSNIAGFVYDTPTDNPATPWNEMTVYTWLAFFPGIVYASCDGITLPAQGVCIKQEINSAWAALGSAQTAAVTAQSQAGKAVANAETAVTAAATALDARKSDLVTLMAGPTADAVQAKKNSVEVAKASLADAEAALADLKDGPDVFQLDIQGQQVATARETLRTAEAALADLLAGTANSGYAAQAKQVTISQANLDKAVADLAKLTSAPDANELIVKQSQVDIARENLMDAETTLASYHQVDDLQIALRESDLIAAKAALVTAEANLEGATLKAPFNGIISSVAVSVGSNVNQNTAAIEIVDPKVVVLSGAVDEIDVLFIRTGDAAAVSLEALGGQVLEGEITSIASAARSQNGVVTYPITITVQPPQNMSLPEGMTAVAQIIVQEQRNGILVPLQAVYGTYQAPVVKLVSSAGKVEERPVTLGISDDFWTVVTSGLAEGDRVAMTTTVVTTSQVTANTLQSFQTQRNLIRGGQAGVTGAGGATGGQFRGQFGGTGGIGRQGGLVPGGR